MLIIRAYQACGRDAHTYEYTTAQQSFNMSLIEQRPSADDNLKLFICSFTMCSIFLHAAAAAAAVPRI